MVRPFPPPAMLTSSAVPMLAAALGLCCFSVMDALMKTASLMTGVYIALLWRSLLGAGLSLALWRPVTRAQWPDRRRLRLHFLRATVMAAMGLLFFWGLVRTPMAVGMALSFVAPLIALFLAAIFLREAVTRRAVVAALLGLAGVLVIGAGRLHAGLAFSGESLWGMLAILCSAVLYAGNLVIQRQQAQLAPPAEIACFQGLFVALWLAPAGWWLGWMPVSAAAWPVLGTAAVLGTASLWLLAWSWARAPAARLLPVEYTAFPWAAVMGRLWFGEPVSSATLGGVVLILLGCWHGLREGPRPPVEKAEPPPVTPVVHIEQIAL